MSFTVSQVALRALVKLHVLVSGETVNASDENECVQSYNAVMFSLEANGLALHDADDVAYTHETQVRGDTFPLHDKHFDGICALVAGHVADAFGVGLTESLARDINTANSRLYGDFLTLSEMTVDSSLRQRRST